VSSPDRRWPFKAIGVHSFSISSFRLKITSKAPPSPQYPPYPGWKCLKLLQNTVKSQLSLAHFEFCVNTRDWRYIVILCWLIKYKLIFLVNYYPVWVYEAWARSNGFNWALLKTTLLCDVEWVDQMSLTLLFTLGNKRKLIQHLSTGRPNMFSKSNSSMSNSVVQRSMLSTIIRGLILARSFKKFLISLFFWCITYITVCEKKNLIKEKCYCPGPSCSKGG